MQHRAGEVALHVGGLPAFVFALVGLFLAWKATSPVILHHTVSYQCPIAGGVCHRDDVSVNDHWVEAVSGGLFGGAVAGLVVANALVGLGIPRSWLGMKKGD
jgi:hypothetical protein